MGRLLDAGLRVVIALTAATTIAAFMIVIHFSIIGFVKLINKVLNRKK